MTIALIGSLSSLDQLLVNGRGHLHFYHVVFFYLAGSMVFADKIMEWISEKIRKSTGLRSLILSELGYVFLTVTLLYHLKQIDPKLSWWEPLVFIGFWLVMRSAYSFVCHLVNID